MRKAVVPVVIVMLSFTLIWLPLWRHTASLTLEAVWGEIFLKSQPVCGGGDKRGALPAPPRSCSVKRRRFLYTRTVFTAHTHTHTHTLRDRQTVCVCVCVLVKDFRQSVRAWGKVREKASERERYTESEKWMMAEGRLSSECGAPGTRCHSMSSQGEHSVSLTAVPVLGGGGGSVCTWSPCRALLQASTDTAHRNLSHQPYPTTPFFNHSSSLFRRHFGKHFRIVPRHVKLWVEKKSWYSWKMSASAEIAIRCDAHDLHTGIMTRYEVHAWVSWAVTQQNH